MRVGQQVIVFFAAAVMATVGVLSPLLSGSLYFRPRRNSKLTLGSAIHSLTTFSLDGEEHDSEINMRIEAQQNNSGVIPRAFQRRSESDPLPCFPAEKDWSNLKVQNSPSRVGFLYLKPFKTGSSTCSGINLRIARNVARRRAAKNNDDTADPMCRSRFSHGPQPFPATSLFQNRNKVESFLWSVIREPTQRAISEFFHFRVSRQKAKPTDENFRRFLLGGRRNKRRDYYLTSLFTRGQFNRTRHDPVNVSNLIIEDYDFLGVTERMEESIVVLTMLLNLPLSDGLYLSAKRHGSFDAGGPNNKCIYIVPKFVTPGMQAILNSAEWRDQVENDRQLYLAVNRSLDLTIERLGHDEFESNLARFRRALQVAEKECLPTTTFPCNATGKFVPPAKTDCLWKDSGCGSTCLDRVATDMGL